MTAMSRTLISLVSTSAGQLSDPVSVELASLDGSYGVRRTDTGSIVVPSGTAMENPQPGLWTYAFTDPVGGITYQCAVKVTTADDAFYFTFYRFTPETDSQESLSASSSMSYSDSEDQEPRSITLVRTSMEREAVEGQGDMFRMALTTQNAVRMPEEVFTFMKGTDDPRDERDPNEYFYFVATPFDATIYPVGSPDATQRPPFFRTNTIELLVPSSQVAEQTEEDFRQELSYLVAAYNRLDFLQPRGEILISGFGSVAAVEEVDALSPSQLDLTLGAQLSLVHQEVDGLDSAHSDDGDSLSESGDSLSESDSGDSLSESESLSPLNYVSLIIITGESNSGGYALNSQAPSDEIGQRLGVQILNNSTFEFEALNIGVNNLIDHAGLSNGSTHGLELGLANSIDDGLWGRTPVYLVKTGQGGSTVGQWTQNDTYFQKFIQRITAAFNALQGAGYVVQPYVWFSQGINDAIAGTPVNTWKTAVLD